MSLFIEYSAYAIVTLFFLIAVPFFFAQILPCRVTLSDYDEPLDGREP